jgi:hypothetical protein
VADLEIFGSLANKIKRLNLNKITLKKSLIASFISFGKPGRPPELRDS